MIWRFEGAIERVSGVALAGWSSHGVTGIPADRVIALRDEGGALATSFYDTASPEASALRAAVEARFGRPVDVVAGSYAVGTLTLPDATMDASPQAWATPPGFDPSVWLSVTWFRRAAWSRSIRQVVAAERSSRTKVAAGVRARQLVASGALEPTATHLHRAADAVYGACTVRIR